MSVSGVLWAHKEVYGECVVFATTVLSVLNHGEKVVERRDH